MCIVSSSIEPTTIPLIVTNSTSTIPTNDSMDHPFNISYASSTMYIKPFITNHSTRPYRFNSTFLSLLVDSSDAKHRSTYDDLRYYTFISTICIICFFILIAICGRIDARLLRRNEIFSIGAIVSATTYTVDIFSGLFCNCVCSLFKL